ncbi:MAG: PEP-CTERM sorting domain-containing protein [Phycisphaerae bacterium]|nr:PEP-CTERM sorting domain-containing protein [Phycisphaerae bacterium]
MKSFKLYRFRMQLFISAAILMMLSQSAKATFSGSATDFYWENGYSINELFTAPILSGENTLVFGVENFRTESLYGEFTSISDTLIFDLIALDGLYFGGITIFEIGDYGIDDGGSVGVSGTVLIENLSASGSQDGELTNDLQEMPQTYVEDGTEWQAEAEVSLEPSKWTHIRITLINYLWAETLECGSTAWIEKKNLDTTIAIQIIPEPATIGLLTLGSLVFLGKKK